MTPNERGPARRPAPNDYGIPATSPHQDTVAQSSLDDLRAYAAESSDRARDTGLQSAASNDAEWCRKVSDWIYDLPAGFALSADTIRSEWGASNASGSVIRTAAHRRVIVHVGWVKSTAVSRHGADIKLWRRT